VNAKGACIGPMGSRVRNVMTELHGEKIDIVDYAEDPADFVGNALSPARVSRVDIVDPVARIARVIVPDYQLSLAIGKEGQNARLAARLTGWKIDIVSDTAPAAAAPAAAAPAAAAPAGAAGAGTAPAGTAPAGTAGAGAAPAAAAPAAAAPAGAAPQGPPAPASPGAPGTIAGAADSATR
jgi:N utilization substance protein A